MLINHPTTQRYIITDNEIILHNWNSDIGIRFTLMSIPIVYQNNYSHSLKDEMEPDAAVSHTWNKPQTMRNADPNGRAV